MENIINDLAIISKKHGITEFIKVESNDELCNCNGEDSYINSSYICGSDRIEIGIYEDSELMIASFFHEIGHITDTIGGCYNSEKRAWEIGFRLADEYGYKFSDNTYRWCEEQLLTYYDSDMKKHDIYNKELFDNWEEIMINRKIRETRERKVKLKKRIRSKRKRKKWYDNLSKRFEGKYFS